MKTLNLFLACSLALSFFACQSIDESSIQDLDSDSNNVVDWNLYDVDWDLSFTPTGVEYLNIGNQLIEIDFTLDEIMAEAISYRSSYFRDNNQVFEGDLFDTFTTFDEIAGFYERSQLGYQPAYSSLSNPFGGEAVYPSIEYALAQECFMNDCPKEIRKAVLSISLEKYERKINQLYLNSFNSRRTGMFLMAVILVKEGNTAFLAAVRENPNIQNTLRLNLDSDSRMNILTGSETDSIICQLAENFLSDDN